MTVTSFADHDKQRSVISRVGERITAIIENQSWLDTPGYKLEHGLALSFTLLGPRSRAAQDLLHGTWLGHPLHPAVTGVPIGAWTTALLLDTASVISPAPDSYRRAAQLAVGAGVLGGAAAAVSGLTDWQHTQDQPRRLGLAHGLLNSAALALNVMSWRDRRQGRLGRARLVSAVAYGLVLASSYLGGTLVFRHRIGVDHGNTDTGPQEFTAMLADTDLQEGIPQRVQADGAAVVLIRHAGQISALADRCSHLGAPLAQGWLYRGALVCPWHGSRFALITGCPVTGPATAALIRYDTRVAGGHIEVRQARASAEDATRSVPAPAFGEQL